MKFMVWAQRNFLRSFYRSRTRLLRHNPTGQIDFILQYNWKIARSEKLQSQQQQTKIRSQYSSDETTSTKKKEHNTHRERKKNHSNKKKFRKRENTARGHFSNRQGSPEEFLSRNEKWRYRSSETSTTSDCGGCGLLLIAGKSACGSTKGSGWVGFDSRSGTSLIIWM